MRMALNAVGHDANVMFRQDAGGVAAATMVGVPKKPLHLPTNYRTHSGILNAAAAVVDILKQYFPMVSYVPNPRCTLLVMQDSAEII